jgi:hypothetical protein
MLQTPSAAQTLFTPPPIQRQDSARWYTLQRPTPPKRQVPLGEQFAAVMDDQRTDRLKMVRGATVELNYVFAPAGAVGKVASGTSGRVSKRILGGWLMVKFDGQSKPVKVRTSNCRFHPSKQVAPAPAARVTGYFTFNRAMCGTESSAAERKELWSKMSTDDMQIWVRAEQHVQSFRK